jgi:outer membrane protein, multidrug efflux system
MCKRSLIFISSFLSLLTGCMLGPKKSLPDVQLPTSYVEKASNEADSSTEADLSIWWKQFDDPFLENLISEALSKNYENRSRKDLRTSLFLSYVVIKALA